MNAIIENPRRQTPQNEIAHDQNNNATSQCNPNNRSKRVQEYADEYHEMPMCAEKLILKLICHSERPSSLLSDGSTDNVQTILADVEARLEVEGLASKQAKDVLSKMKTSPNLKTDMLEQMLACIRDIDIHRLKRLATRNNEAIEVLRGQNVYLFMGLTGHGKSTAIHYLAGSKFEEFRVNGEVAMFGPGRPHYVPVSCPSGLERVTTSPYPESDTHNIIPVVVNLPDGRKVILCDAPGFEDTNGAELDIANSIAIKNSISVCEAVKPIIVISKNLGERMASLSQLTGMLSKMVNNMSENISHFTYVFTNYTREEAGLINSSINDLVQTESFRNSTDEGYKILIYDMATKTRYHPIIIDLNELTNRNDVINDALSRILVQNPSRFFKLTLGLKSQKALGDQIYKHTKAIKNAFERGDKDLAVYKMGELMYLRELFDGMEIFDRKFEDIKNIFTEYFNNKAFRIWPKEHKLTIADLETLCLALQEAQTIQEFKKMLFGEDQSYESLRNNFIEYVDQMTDINSVSSDIDSVSPQTKVANLKLLSSYLVTSPVCNEFSGAIVTKYNKTCERLRAMLDEKVKSCREAINLNPPQLIGNKLFALFCFYELFKDYLIENETNIHNNFNQTQYTSIKNDVIDSVSDKVDEIISLLENVDQNSFPRLDSLQKYIRYLLDDVCSNDFLKTKDRDFIDSINSSHSEMLARVRKFFDEFKTQINIEQPNLEVKFQKLQLLRNNIEIARTTEQIFLDIKFNIDSKLMRALNTITQGISFSDDGMIDANMDTLIRSIQSLQRLNWVDKIIETKSCEDGLKDIEWKLVKNIEYRSDVLGNVDLTEYGQQVPKNDDKLEKAFNLTKKMDAYRELGRVFPNLPGRIDEAVNIFQNKIMDELNRIIDLFKIEDMENQRTDFKRAEAALNFLYKTAVYQDRFSRQLVETHQLAINNLCQHLRRRYKWLEENLEYQFATLQSNSDETSMDQSAREIYQHMKQIQNTFERTSLPEGFGLNFNDLYNSYRVRLHDFFPDVRHGMQQAQVRGVHEPSFLQRELRKVKCLFVLNEFLGREQNDPNFRNLFHEFNRIAFEQMNRSFDESLGFLRNLAFEQLADNMNSLQASTNESAQFYLGILKQRINSFLQNAVEELTTSIYLSSDLEPNNITTMKKLLSAIRKANIHLSTFIDESTRQQVQDVRQHLKEQMSKTVTEYLSRLDYFLNSFDVDQFSAKLRNVIDQIPHLQELCGGDKDTNERLEDLKLRGTNMLNDAIGRLFRDLDLDTYSHHHPSVILNRLANNYRTECELIKTLILKKYTQELEAARKCEDFKNNEHFRKCERNKLYLSPELRGQIDEMIADYDNKNSREQTSLETELKQLLETNQLIQIRERFNRAETSPSKREYHQIKLFIREAYSETENGLHQALDEWNSAEVLKKSRLIVDFEKSFDNLFPDKNRFNEVNAFFMKKANLLIEQMKQNLTSPDRQSELTNIYNMLSELLGLQVEGFQGTMQLVNDEVYANMKSFNDAFDKGLKEEDFERVKNAMSSAQAIDSIWSRHEKVNELMGYERMKSQLRLLIKSENNGFVGAERSFLLTGDTNMYEKDYDDYFARLKKQKNLLKKLNTHFEDLYPVSEPGRVNQDFNDHQIDETMKETLGRADQILTRILNGNNTISELKDFKVLVYNLNSYEKIMCRRVSLNRKPVLDHFLDQVMDKIQKITEPHMLDSIQRAAECFVRIKTLSTNLVLFKAKIDEELERVMQAHIRRIGFNMFGQLAIKLRESNEGRMIVHEHACFEGYQRSVFNEKTIRQDINYVINATHGEGLDKKVLSEKYTEFSQLYEQLVVEHLSDNNLEVNEEQLKTKINYLAESIKIFDSNMRVCWDNTKKNKIPKLLAHLFALWTVMNSRGFFETTEFLFKPHPAQIISVFRMLGIGYTQKSQKLDSNLVQLGTGEGKSITLGITCALLALLGFDVQCVCYSQYLSDRDLKAFKPLFEMLRVEQFIQYGTFKQICESFINKCGDVRKIVETFLKQDAIPESSKASRDHRPKILLIDEVDVFFSKDFYGSSYNPVVSLKSPTIEALVREIWTRRQNISIETVKSFTSYQSCSKEFPGWKITVFNRFVEAMIDSLAALNDHEYIVRDDKIGYTSQDGVDFNTLYSYQTMFAYFKENERRMISDKSLKSNISMILNVGNYSFAEIPKSFEAIIGLSGTLDSLTESQKNIVKNEYGIKLMTFIPSVYGDKKLVFDKIVDIDIFIENIESYHKGLVQHIRYSQIKYNEACKRPILIFFEDKEMLMKLYNSEEYREFRNDTAYLIEEASAEEKTHIIMNATSEGKKLLATRIFGRGTDFVVYNTKLNPNGGVHVIQTFLSEELSEEIQIKGRTARQGDKGSYSMFLLDSSLAKFNITAESLAQNKSRLYDHLHEKRNEYFSNKYSESIKNVDKIKNLHSQSMNFLNDLKAKNYQKVQKFMIDSIY